MSFKVFGCMFLRSLSILFDSFYEIIHLLILQILPEKHSLSLVDSLQPNYDKMQKKRQDVKGSCALNKRLPFSLPIVQALLCFFSGKKLPSEMVEI
jgi:hypothetical protein